MELSSLYFKGLLVNIFLIDVSLSLKNISEYDQNISQSRTADQSYAL